MIYDLPIFVEINGKRHSIRNNCDYRVVLDAICALNDNSLTDQEKIQCALFIFYENFPEIEDMESAALKMFEIINNGENDSHKNSARLMDWEHDFKQIAPPVSRVLGYDVRTPGKYTHWWTFLGGYMEIGGDSPFATIVSIRSKKARGQKLEKWEIDFAREHKKMIDLPQKFTAEEEKFFDSLG